MVYDNCNGSQHGDLYVGVFKLGKCIAPQHDRLCICPVESVYCFILGKERGRDRRGKT